MSNGDFSIPFHYRDINTESQAAPVAVEDFQVVQSELELRLSVLLVQLVVPFCAAARRDRYAAEVRVPGTFSCGMYTTQQMPEESCLRRHRCQFRQRHLR